MDKSNIDKIAQTADDKVLLAKTWDKINAGIRRNVPSKTAFLSPRELEMTRFLFGKTPGLLSYGGYSDAERKLLLFIPDYLDMDSLLASDPPLVCIRADFYENDTPSHRDFLGALLGCGIARETIGDICVSDRSCFFFVTGEIASYVLQNFNAAGRTKLHLTPVPIDQLVMPERRTTEIRDTVASIRLDSIVSSGFRIGRSAAAQHIISGHAAINGLPCEKPDKPVLQDDVISVRGLGKIRLRIIGKETKKGRIGITIDKYL